MNRKLLALIILGIIPVIILPIYAADPSEKFTFQGVLKDSSSNLVTGTKDITLDFYTASSGGTLRFSNLCNDTSVSSGLFTCTITNPYDNFFAQALFVEVKVADSDGGNSETLTPRIELVGAPYSISALKAGNNFDLLQNNLVNVTSITSESSLNMTVGTNADFTVDDRTFTVDTQNNRVGIGTTNPTSALQIVGAIGSDISPNEKGFQLSTGDGSPGNVHLDITSDGGTPYMDWKNDLGTGDNDFRFILVGDDIMAFEGGSAYFGSTSETIGNSEFVAGADDVFVADMLGVETAIVTDGYINATSIEIGNTVNGYAANFTGTNSDTAIVLINNTSTSSGSDALRIDLGTTTTGPADCFFILNDRDENLGNWCGNSLGGTAFTTGAGLNMTLSGGATGDFTVDDMTFTVDSENNRVGIGTTNPGAALEVTASSTTEGVLILRDTNADANDRILHLQLPDATPATADHYVSFRDSGFGLDGQIRGTGAGGVAYDETSDKRLKNNIRDTAYSLDDLLKIQVRDFERGEFQLTQTGFIAQELYEVYPQIVYRGGDEVSDPEILDVWALDYGKLTPLLVQAIQDQQSQIEQLKQIVCIDHPEAEICQVE